MSGFGHSQGRGVIMSSWIVLRRIAILIKFLKQELKPEHRPELGDADLATLLNEVQSAPPNFTFTGARVNELLNAKMRLNPGKETAVLNTLQRLLDAKTRHTLDVTKDPPQWIEDQCASGLREGLRELPAGAVIQGEHLGDKAKLLEGVWESFVVILSEQGGLEPYLLRFPLIFRQSSPTHMSLLMISRNREWRGAAHMIGSHLYMHLRDVSDTKTATFITNLPVKQRLKISGVGTTVAPESGVDPNPAVIGALCFGQKWRPPLRADDALAAAAVRLVQAGGHIDEADIQTMRVGFCKPFKSKEDFALDYAELLAYMKYHKINGQADFPLHTLHVAY